MDYKPAVHDTVRIVKNEKGKEENYWGRSVYTGVVMSANEEEVTIKNSNGETVDVPLQLEKYNITIDPFSEIEFEEEIEKSLKVAQQRIQEYIDAEARIRAWQLVYTTKVTLLGKLFKMVKDRI